MNDIYDRPEVRAAALQLILMVTARSERFNDREYLPLTFQVAYKPLEIGMVPMTIFEDAERLLCAKR